MFSGSNSPSFILVGTIFFGAFVFVLGVGFFGAAFLGDQTGNCSALSIEEESISEEMYKEIDNRIQKSINITAGPSGVIIIAKDDYFDVDLKVFDLMGGLVYQHEINHLPEGTLRIPIDQIPLASVSLIGKGWRLSKKVFFYHK